MQQKKTIHCVFNLDAIENQSVVITVASIAIAITDGHK